MSTRTPVHVDTDVGGDFDDANALAFLMGTPHVDLVAVTTVGAGGNARHRAEVAAHLLEAGGHEHVPVSAGIDQPILPNPVLRSLTPAWILNAYDPSMSSTQVTSHDAVDALLRSADEHGSDLTILCIGCLTNLAAATRRSPATMAAVGEIVVMGGAFREQSREANIAIDPEAADIVFRSNIPLRAVGVEVARQIAVPIGVHDDAASSGTTLGQRLGALARRYADAYSTDRIVLYDVTAAAAVTDPDLFAFEEVTVAVELNGTHSRGMTVVATDPCFNDVADGVRLRVATSCDTDRVRDLFVERVLEGDWSR